MILIVDFGSQTAHLIGRRLRACGVNATYTSPEEALEQIRLSSPKGIILSGGPSSVYADGAPSLDMRVLQQGLPVLGICYGWQLMAHLLGGSVERGTGEYGPETLRVSTSSCEFLKRESCVFMSHGDCVTSLPPGFRVAGSTRHTQHAMVLHEEHSLMGVQFHPEVQHTELGREILRHFALDLCQCQATSFSLDPAPILERIQHTVKDQHVICGVSGGVDSTVAASLIAKAIGPALHPVYIESGLMRPGTKERVQQLFDKHFHIPLIIVEAEEVFMQALRGIADPETKRKVIGKLYVDLFEEQAHKLPDATFLGQGTIYSDVIESKGSKHASSIKSHHNVGGLPEGMKFQLLEPLRTYYKDEVRAIGALLGLPQPLLQEHPFPGPGYAIRIRGEVTYQRLSQVRQADAIVVEELQRAGLYEELFQCFAVMTGAFSTAVKGDGREFSEVVAIRAYHSDDVMTSEWAKVPYGVLQKLSSRIVNEVPSVSRVVYDITTKPPATLEWE